MDSLASKTLIMIVGPTAIGKSTLMNHVATIEPAFARVKSFTTRPPRENDEPDQYFYLTPESLDEQLGAGTVITDVTLAGTDLHYGTLINSYRGEFNMLDTLAQSVATYRSLPFYSKHTISLTTEPTAWLRWLQTRYPEPSELKTKRLEEAKVSITWSLAQQNNHHWLINTPDSLEETARQLIRIGRDEHTQASETAKQYAMTMLDAIDSLLSLN